ncbi:hypothetical protein WMY93_022399 [Mugilogobius chulae]|uniref:Mitochondrial fission factor n=1 Tax=Mugilogobius chulae TaxID=88201 RepID=A0AAW0NH25_9GOBI
MNVNFALLFVRRLRKVVFLPRVWELRVNTTMNPNTPLLVRSSSDSVLPPPLTVKAPPPPDDQRMGTPEPQEVSHVLRGALERLKLEEQQQQPRTRMIFNPNNTYSKKEAATEDSGRPDTEVKLVTRLRVDETLEVSKSCRTVPTPGLHGKLGLDLQTR